MKCIHEWRLWGTRLEESVSTPVRTEPTEESGPIICTKCGIEQNAQGYEWVEERPVPAYSGSWADFSKDIIVKPKKFAITQSTMMGYNSRKDEMYEETIFNWDEKEQQWVKTYPKTAKDYWQCIKKML